MPYQPRGFENGNLPNLFPDYRIHYSEEDSEGLATLNFSRNVSPKTGLPDYTAGRLEISEDEEVWRVRNGGGRIDIPINSYRSKNDLAYKLENAYHALLDD